MTTKLIECDSCGRESTKNYGYPEDGDLCLDCWRTHEVDYIESQIQDNNFMIDIFEKKNKLLRQEIDELQLL